MGVPGGVLGGSEMSQYLVLKHFLSWPERVLFLNDVFLYLYTIYNKQIDLILQVCLFSSVNHYLMTFLTLSKIFHIIFFLSFTKVVFVIVTKNWKLRTKLKLFRKILGTKIFTPLIWRKIFQCLFLL